MRSIIIKAIFFFALIPAIIFAGEFSKVGTTAAQFLKISVGARGAAMGDAYTAVADNTEALYWNPAGLTNIHEISLDVSHSQWFADISHNFVGVAIPLSDNDVLGVNVVNLSTPEQEVTTAEEPDGTGVYYKVSDLALGLSYARVLTDRFSVGVTAKYIQENAYNESANTFAIDIGTLLRTDFYGLIIGMSITNFGGNMQLEGRDLITTSDISTSISGEYNPSSNLTAEEWPLPLNFRIGTAIDIVGNKNPVIYSGEHRFTLAIDGSHPNDNVERLNIGGEYGWDETLFLRAGYKINYDVEKWTFGAGVKTRIEGSSLTFDFAYVDYYDLGKVSRFSVGITF